jgi:hypothetical protein
MNVTPYPSLNHTENALRHYFEERLNKPVSLFLTENSTSMLSARVWDGITRIRLHRIFLNFRARNKPGIMKK